MSIGLPDSQWLTIPAARAITVFGAIFIIVAVVLFIRQLSRSKNREGVEVKQESIETKEIQYKYGRITALELLDINKRMIDQHGHDDWTGIQLDLKSGVPPNKITSSPCHKCGDGTLRNQRSTKGYII